MFLKAIHAEMRFPAPTASTTTKTQTPVLLATAATAQSARTPEWSTATSAYQQRLKIDIQDLVNVPFSQQAVHLHNGDT